MHRPLSVDEEFRLHRGSYNRQPSVTRPDAVILATVTNRRNAHNFTPFSGQPPLAPNVSILREGETVGRALETRTPAKRACSDCHSKETQ
jgi:hypothetical protein